MAMEIIRSRMVAQSLETRVPVPKLLETLRFGSGKPALAQLAGRRLQALAAVDECGFCLSFRTSALISFCKADH
jgi:hypothetical protein